MWWWGSWNLSLKIQAGLRSDLVVSLCVGWDKHILGYKSEVSLCVGWDKHILNVCQIAART